MRLLQVLECDDLAIGARVVTPSGREATVVKKLKGTSRQDHFTRVIIRYIGAGVKCQTQLQPQLLRIVIDEQ